ncbi:MAG: 3-deoxy-D-manno-octulosonic acid transferase [Candidatus Omnitrophota bacterium]|jgi:3-deoxy-D-manno-octulosonic-acid transferase
MIYDIAFLIFSVFYLPVLLFKGKMHGDFAQRFGKYDSSTSAGLDSGDATIWIEAVSVGEVSLCKGFIPMLKGAYPASAIVISTVTKAGNDLAKKMFAGSATVIYFPLDLSFVVKKALDKIRPKLYIMVETEIWPNLLKELSARGVPSIVINGRISDRSFGKYKLAAPFLRNTMERISLYCMRSQTDADRIKALGAPADRVKVTGNMKFDIPIASSAITGGRTGLLPGISEDDALFVCGSTHKGEEEMITDIYRELLGEFKGLRLLIAPRHIDRVNEIEEVVRRSGLKPVRVSSLRSGEGQGKDSITSTVLILDTIGRLNDIYSIATIVFIGGSMVPYGGHNPIEPAVFEKPVLFGEHMFNFKDTALLFLDNEAAIQVSDRRDLLEKCKGLLMDGSKRSRLGQNAKRIVLENRGAAERNLNHIRKIYE